MPAEIQVDLVRDYGHWLKERLVSARRGDAHVLSTPFLDPFNDGICIHAEPRGGEWVLHDNGDTLDTLGVLGVKIEDSERRRNLIQRAIAGCAVQFDQGRLMTTATMANLPQRIHFLLTAIIRLNDLWMSSVPHRWTDFFEMVQEFFDSKGVLYTANVSIPGKTVEHSIDFVIPLPKRRERLVKLIADPKPQTAKVISFSWMELRESRPDADRIVLLNDLRAPDPLDQESEDEHRRISEQTDSILRGYSNSLFKWSERDQPGFDHLWRVA